MGNAQHVTRRGLLRILGVTGICALNLACSGAPAAPATGAFVIAGDASQGVSFGPNATPDPWPTYHVSVTVTNKNSSPLSFDTALGVFFIPPGSGVESPITQSNGALYRIEAGGQHKFEYDTASNTPDLLGKMMGGASMYFQLALLLQGRPVQAPIQAVLPTPERLPAPGQAGVPLKFQVVTAT